MEGLFSHTLNAIENEDFISRNRTDSKAFIRNRKLSFKDLMVNLMGFTRPGVQTELDRFYKSMSKSTSSFNSISKSAFTQARRKLKPEAFVELTQSHLSYFHNYGPHKKLWENKRIIAIDGSLLNLPYSDELAASFGFVKNQYDVRILGARCSVAYDVCNELVLDASIAARTSCEKDLAVGHLKQLCPQTDILVFDRGYPALWLMGLLQQHGFKFCFRLSTAWKDAKALIDSKHSDVDWSSERRSKKELGKLKEYDLPVRLDGLRLVSIELSTGEKEVLATNLIDRSTFTLEKLKDLYHLRWGIEENYKTFKQVSQIEYFTGRTAQAVKQDFYARICMANLASMISSQGLYDQKLQKSKRNKHPVKPNKTQVLAKTKDFLVDLLYSDEMTKLLQQMLKLLKNCFDIIRPNRNFPRPRTSHRRHKLTNMKGI